MPKSKETKNGLKPNKNPELTKILRGGVKRTQGGAPGNGSKSKKTHQNPTAERELSPPGT